MARFRWLVLGLLVLAVDDHLSHAVARQNAVSNRQVAATVPEEFKPLYDMGTPSGGEAVVWAGFPYDSISLERTPCFGGCPVYRLTLSRGGQAELHSSNWRQWQGDYAGKVSVFAYGRLCYVMKEFQFERLAPRYIASWTDASTTIVTAVAGNVTTRVSEYSAIGPIRLWAVQQAIDAVAQDVNWTRKPARF